MIQFISILVISLCLGSEQAIADQKVTLYGDDAYPPYSYLEDGQFKGIYVDFLRQATQKLKGYLLDFVPVSYKRGLFLLETGEALALIPPYYRPKERPYVWPYSEPLHQETVVLACNDEAMKKNPKKFPADFKDITIGMTLGFVVSGRLIEARDAGKIKIEEAKGSESNIQKLANNHIGCYANDRLTIDFALKTLKEAEDVSPKISQVKLTPAYELSHEVAYVGFSRKSNVPYKKDFIQKLNHAILEAKQKGIMEKLIKSYTQH